MPNYNKVILIGHLTRDPEIRYLPNGNPVAQLGIATSRKWKSENGDAKEETCFADVTFFGKQAETVGQYMKKGAPMMIEGRLRTESWTDKQSGQKRSKLSVMGEGFQFLATKDRAESYRSGDGPDSDTPQTERRQAQVEAQQPEDEQDNPF